MRLQQQRGYAVDWCTRLRVNRIHFVAIATLVFPVVTSILFLPLVYLRRCVGIRLAAFPTIFLWKPLSDMAWRGVISGIQAGRGQNCCCCCCVCLSFLQWTLSILLNEFTTIHRYRNRITTAAAAAAAATTTTTIIIIIIINLSRWLLGYNVYSELPIAHQ